MEVFILFRVPRTIICHNDPAFLNREFRKLADQYRTSLKFTPFYNPQVNPIERGNRVVETMRAMYISYSHRTWDKHLSEIGCALRTSTHESIRRTPYFVNFDRDMLLSGEGFVQKDLLGNEDGTQVGGASRNEQFRAQFRRC